MNELERIALVARRLVSCVKTLERPHEDRHRDGNRNRFPAVARRPHQAGERLPLHVLHDEKKLAIGRDDIERSDDIRVTDASRQSRFVEEHRDEFGLLGVLRMQPLDGHRTREAHRAQQPADVYRRHAAGRDFVVKRVAPDDARMRGHG